MDRSTRTNLLLKAQRQAFQVRQQLNLDLFAPIAVYDVAEKRGVEVRFVDISSMEGMYSRQPKPTIVVTSLRPSGRQAFTCAHELGHHEFDHSGRIDELVEQSPHSPDEFLANAFAGALLMPKTGVLRAFSTRGWRIENAASEQLYTVACLFGVGYTTLIRHMADTLEVLPDNQRRELSKVQPKEIRRNLLGFDHDGELIAVDDHWTGRAIDVHVGDMILLPANVQSESIGNTQRVSLVDFAGSYSVYQATAPGLGRFFTNERHWSSFFRVAKKEFVGRNIYRHLEDPDYDQ